MNSAKRKKPLGRGISNGSGFLMAEITLFLLFFHENPVSSTFDFPFPHKKKKCSIFCVASKKLATFQLWKYFRELTRQTKWMNILEMFGFRFICQTFPFLCMKKKRRKIAHRKIIIRSLNWPYKPSSVCFSLSGINISTILVRPYCLGKRLQNKEIPQNSSPFAPPPLRPSA